MHTVGADPIWDTTLGTQLSLDRNDLRAIGFSDNEIAAILDQLHEGFTRVSIPPVYDGLRPAADSKSVKVPIRGGGAFGERPASWRTSAHFPPRCRWTNRAASSAPGSRSCRRRTGSRARSAEMGSRKR